MTKATSLQKHKHKPEINTYCYFWIPHIDVFFTKKLKFGHFLSEFVCLTLLTWIFHFTIFSLNFDWSVNKGSYTINWLRSVKIYIPFLFFSLSHSDFSFFFHFYERPANKNVSHCKTKPNYLKHVINDALIRRQMRYVCTWCEFTLRNRRLEQRTIQPVICMRPILRCVLSVT